MTDPIYRITDGRGQTNFWLKPDHGEEYLHHVIFDSGIGLYYDEKRDFHREDGPARVFPSDYGWKEEYYIHGEYLGFINSDEELKAYLNLKAFW